MRIDKKYRLWEITKLAGGERPSLEQILIARTKPVNQPDVLSEQYPDWIVMPLQNEINNGVAITTDGFSLAVVPVELFDEDVPGLISGELMELANKKASVRDEVYIELKEDEIIIPFIGQKNNREKDLTFPDVQNIIQGVRDGMKNEDRKCHLMFDNIRLTRLLKALGRKTTGKPANPNTGGNTSIFLYSVVKEGQTGMILVTTQKLTGEETIVPPFGILMEMHK